MLFQLIIFICITGFQDFKIQRKYAGSIANTIGRSNLMERVKNRVSLRRSLKCGFTSSKITMANRRVTIVGGKVTIGDKLYAYFSFLSLINGEKS